MTLKELCERLENLEKLIGEICKTESGDPYLEISLDSEGGIEMSYREWWRSSEWTLFSIDSHINNIEKDLSELEENIRSKKLSWL